MNKTVPLFTIIIPVYNATKYLPRCIDSVLAQTYQNFELILINDGSKDLSGAICDDYALKDSRVRVFHKENGGVSSARNMGIKEAIGTYITFIDSDDWIEVDFLEHFKKITNSEESDLIVSGVIKYFDEYSNKNSTFCTEKANNLYAIPMLEEKSLLSGPFAKCFKTKVIRVSTVLFDERFHFGEDAIFNLSYILKVTKITVVDYAGYYYFQTPGESLVKKKYSYEKTIEFAKTITNLRYEMLNKFELDKGYINFIEKEKTLYTINAILSAYNKKYRKEKNERMTILKNEIPNLNIKLLPKGKYYEILKFLFQITKIRILDYLLIVLFKK